MTYIEYEKLGYYDLKSKLIDYAQRRVIILKSSTQNNESDYHELKGRIEEIEALNEFLQTESRRRIEEDSQKLD